MNDPSGQDCGPPGLNNNLFVSNLCSECSRFNCDLLTFIEMYVKRRAFRSRWQRTVERQNGLALRVAHPAHLQDFSSVAELQPQKVIHDCPPLTHQLRKN